MAKIFPSDIIFATVIQRGRTIATVKVSGITTFAEIVKSVYEQVKDTLGLITLHIRNSSQGWNHQKNIMLSPLNLR